MAIAPRARMRIVLLLVALAACGRREDPTQHFPRVDNSFTLYVSNQSFALDPVDIAIEIDGKTAVTGDFLVEGQHTWIQFDFALTPGTHRIVATTADVNDVVLDKTFEMTARKYGVVMFWYYPDQANGAGPTPPQFSWSLTDEQPGFQ